MNAGLTLKLAQSVNCSLINWPKISFQTSQISTVYIVIIIFLCVLYDTKTMTCFCWTKITSREHSMFTVIQFPQNLLFCIQFFKNMVISSGRKAIPISVTSKSLKHTVYSEVMKAWIFWHNPEHNCMSSLSTKMSKNAVEKGLTLFLWYLHSLNVGGPSFIASINHMAVIISATVRNTDLSHNKHEAFLTCLETMSNHLMTAHTKHTVKRMTSFQFCLCLGLYSN